MSLFHAYVIGGDRENAKILIEGIISEHLGDEPDVVRIERTNFTIEDSRGLKEWSEQSSNSKKKFYIAHIDFIDVPAQNALLKTFEEPAPDTHMFLSMPDPEILVETLRSRVRIIQAEKKSDAGEEKSINEFLSMTSAGKLAFVGKMLEKGDDEEASSEVRKRALNFLNLLEENLSADPKKNAEKLETILRLKKFLYTPGSSVRMILETIALTS